MEPMGVLGDLGWYPISAILFAFDYEIPIEVKWSHNTVNPNGFLLSGSGFLSFSGDRYGTFEFSAMLPARAAFEIVGSEGVIAVNDFVGGNGVSGDLRCYFNKYVGSD
jgi:predicted dehydrogenase